MNIDPQLPLPGALVSWTQHWIAIDKPSGLLSRPGPGHSTSALSELERWLRRTSPHTPAPGVVHRLDRDTSGVLLFSLGPAGHRALVRAFATRRIRKEYLAVVRGTPRPQRGLIDLPLRRNSSGRVVPDRDGIPARTRYETVRAAAGAALVRVFPMTGRMHQIRVHLAARGTPVLGDRVYGTASTSPGRSRASQAAFRLPKPPRLCLHARAVILPDEMMRNLGARFRLDRSPLQANLNAPDRTADPGRPADSKGVASTGPPEAAGPIRIEAPLTPDLLEYLARLTLSGPRE